MRFRSIGCCEAVWVNDVTLKAFWLQPDHMVGLGGKSQHFLFYGRAIARTLSTTPIAGEMRQFITM